MCACQVLLVEEIIFFFLKILTSSKNIVSTFLNLYYYSQRLFTTSLDNVAISGMKCYKIPILESIGVSDRFGHFYLPAPKIYNNYYLFSYG